ncbi:LuxR family transcriptional regulator [Lentzea tibetensis]|uniref:LuxR family transcriptional regulator n=1 Tax=Lentzea tibetensis TaxID=2591470 RepID=A0A563F0T2_9PSEU|nr:LuxR C-terminal-related transcriptional regulator [Lentzea tibetensis]TWP53503.1 LuxR family transcriptional regulator [Lentzea tibetensis]
MSESGTCESCGTAMTPRQANARVSRYCSNACRQRAYRQRLSSTPSDPDLPEYPDVFIGRESEIADLGPLLRKHRLLTLLGPGGVGKTRLVMELLRLSRHIEARVVEIARLTRPEQVVQAVAEAAGVPELPGTPLRARVLADLAGRKITLVLDSCEHLVDACCELVDEMLARCPGVRVLTTSREALRAVGEAVYPLKGLSVEGRPWSEAERLFVERARESATTFQPSESDHDLIAAVCARLDGIPLAIELAARLVRPLSVREISHHLDRRLDLLNIGHRGAEARHQSLRAAIAWSYDLLTSPEQTLFRRLSLLPGGFALDTAQVVFDGDVLGTLTNLEAKSLVSREGNGRFRMLESVRLYALERLREHGEEEVMNERILTWLCEIAEPGVTSSILTERQIRRQRDEYDNVAYAFGRMADVTDERRLMLASILLRVRFDQGYVTEAGAVLVDVLATTPATSRFRCLALEYAALFALHQGHLDDGHRYATEAIDTASTTGQERILCRLYRTLASVCMARGDTAATIVMLRRSIEHGLSNGNEISVACTKQNLAWILLIQGDIAGARELVDVALPSMRAHARPDIVAVVLHTTGCVALEAGDHGWALSCFEEGVRVGVDALRTYLDCIEGCGVIALRSGQLERGVRLLFAGESARMVLDWAREPWWQERYDLALTTARELLSRNVFEQASVTGCGMDLYQAADYALDEDSWRPEAEPVLSARQQVVAGMIAQGMTNVQIAARLNISHRTVESHVRNIKTALDVSSRAQLAAWVSQQSS